LILATDETRIEHGQKIFKIRVSSVFNLWLNVSATMDSKKLAQLCRDFADNKKAENIVILDVRDLSSVTDYFVIASGTSEPHLRAIVDEITDRLRDEHDLRPLRKDGSMQGAWVVLDFFDVIVHVMRTDARERYDLEGLWGDAARVKSKSKPAKIKPTSRQASKKRVRRVEKN
jgi:ribosome-associated protein